MEKKIRQVKLHSTYRCSRASGWHEQVGNVVAITVENKVLTIKNRASHGNH